MFPRGDFGWKDADELVKAASTVFVFSLLYLISMEISGKFVPSHVAFAGVFAGIGFLIFGLNREVSLTWAGLSGFVNGVMVYLQSVAVNQGASEYFEVILLISNVLIMTVLFIASFVAVELVFRKIGED